MIWPVRRASSTDPEQLGRSPSSEECEVGKTLSISTFLSPGLTYLRSSVMPSPVVRIRSLPFVPAGGNDV